MVKIEEYINFAQSLVEMDEVKTNKFPLPGEIVFNLNTIDHTALQSQLHDIKGLDRSDFSHTETFTVSILNIDFTFKEIKDV
jgi:hypothetical protein